MMEETQCRGPTPVNLPPSQSPRVPHSAQVPGEPGVTFTDRRTLGGNPGETLELRDIAI